MRFHWLINNILGIADEKTKSYRIMNQKKEDKRRQVRNQQKRNYYLPVLGFNLQHERLLIQHPISQIITQKMRNVITVTMEVKLI